VLADDVSVSRRLVSDAYEQLRAEGWLTSRRGAGTWVAPEAPRRAAGARPPRRRGPRARPPRYDFFPGVPDLAGFPRAAWARALRDTVREAPDRTLGYPDPRGPRALRAELAAYLRRARGLDVDPDALVVCSGAMQAVSLLARVLVRRGDGSGRIAVEDPSLDLLRAAAAYAGAEIVPVPVDTDGIDVAAFAATDAGAVLVTPAHQFPTGVPLSSARRSALMEWARAGAGRLVIEDDYSAEFRYDRPALAALQGLAPDRVAHVGSVSKALAPALRLGWLVPPPELLGDVLEARAFSDGGPPALEALALARLLAAGEYDRHLRAARRRYRERRVALEAALARHLPAARITGVPGGLHAPVALPAVVDATRLTEESLARGVAVYPLAWFAVNRPAETAAVVLGYGNLPEPGIAEGVRRFAGAVRALI
jgi:GntR family transcriptional regulator/MocR family aminotransferase